MAEKFSVSLSVTSFYFDLFDIRRFDSTCAKMYLICNHLCEQNEFLNGMFKVRFLRNNCEEKCIIKGVIAYLSYTLGSQL